MSGVTSRASALTPTKQLNNIVNLSTAMPAVTSTRTVLGWR